MLKLALSGFESRFRDYLVLFSGLIMSSAIFYLFESLATNNAFIKANAIVSGGQIIFQLGAVLLGIITFVYVMYANSFLLQLRQHDYGLFMMLGAKQSRIGQLILLETLVVGVMSTIIGVFVGLALTQILGNALMAHLGLTVQHFSAFNGTAIISTLVFYLILFVIAGGMNVWHMTRTSALKLLQKNDLADTVVIRPWRQLAEMIMGLLLLAIGYTAMAYLTTLQLTAIPIALVTIVLGTYFIFHSGCTWLIVRMQNTNFASRGLRSFTLAQLAFRIKQYTKILSIVTILFAMALGAITVGLGYQNQIPEMAQTMTPYTMGIANPTVKQVRDVNRLNLSDKVSYQQKQVGKQLVVSDRQFTQHPLLATKPMDLDHGGAKFETYRMTLHQLKVNPSGYSMIQNGSLQALPVKVVSDRQFNRLAQPKTTLLIFRVRDLAQSQSDLKRLAASLPYSEDQLGGAYSQYQMGKSVFGGMAFMGLFLGIAFLAMFASCLMFKILSGASTDQRRYDMLYKLGAQRQQLSAAMAKEIGFLFALPGILGIVHVLFGLQLFKPIMLNPYNQLGLPFGIFLILYGVYYLVTVWLYRQLVLTKRT